MLNWFRGKSLEKHLSETRKVRVSGVRFTIKKINSLNYLDGSKVMIQAFDTYKVGALPVKNAEGIDKKAREHLSHVIVAGTVSPKLTHKKEDTGICVEELFVDLKLVLNLYTEIMDFTYGKKKVNRRS